MKKFIARQAAALLFLLLALPAVAWPREPGTWGEIGAAVAQSQAAISDARDRGRLSAAFQRQALKSAGGCVSAMAELEQKTDFSKGGAREEAKAAFAKNGALLRDLIAVNRSAISALEETRLEGGKDSSALFASPEWQEPQSLAMMAGYWLSWNNYYCALLYGPEDLKKHELLEEAQAGFGGTLLSVREEGVALRSLYGRGLCQKEMGRYDKALQDLGSVVARAGRDDTLRLQAAYERALISYLTKNNDQALARIRELEADPAAARVLKGAPGRLASTIARETVEKQAARPGAGQGGDIHETVRELARLAAASDEQAGALYQFVAGHAGQLKDAPEAELGPAGSLAIADWHFNQKQFGAALDPYRRLYAAADRSVQQYRPDICFRLAYCLCNGSQWQEAAGCLETLFDKYPKSTAAAQAACLYYLAAANAYKQSPGQPAYNRYIRAAQSYIKGCPDTKDKSEAHYQLGRYYREQKKEAEAAAEFSLVGPDSPHFGESRLAAIAAGLDTVESLRRDGGGDTEEAKKQYQKTSAQIVDCRKALAGASASADRELEARLAILQARLAACGPDQAVRDSLRQLDGIESRLSGSADRARLLNDAAVLRMQGMLRLGMLKEADAAAAAFLKSGGAESWTFLNQCAAGCYERSNASRERGDDAAARAEAEKALSLYPRLCDASAGDPARGRYYEPLLLRTAGLYEAVGRSAKARELYERVLARNPRQGDAWYSLARLDEGGGDWEKVRDDWAAIARGLAPGSHRWLEARYRCARAYVELGKSRDACEMLSLTRSLYPQLESDELRDDYAKLQTRACPPDAGRPQEGGL